MVPSKDPYREKMLSKSPLGPMEPEIIKEELFAKPKLIPKPKTLERDISIIIYVLGLGSILFFLVYAGAVINSGG